MSFPSLVAAMDAACLSTFGCQASGITVVYTPQNGSGAQNIDGIIQNPTMAEDYVPGSSQGVSAVQLFVRFATLSPLPQKGDRITIGGKNYVIENIPVDVAGGAVLKLRKQ